MNVTESGRAPVTRAFAEFVAATAWSDLSEDVRHAARRTFGNFAALAVGASHSDAVGRVSAALAPLGQPAAATALGRSGKVGVEAAAMLNGFAAHLEDFDDTHLATVVHPGAPIAPAALALAEQRGIGGEELLTAMAVGVEVSLRFGNGVCPEHFDRAWHLTGTAGHIGAAAAAGRVIGLDPDRLVVAIGLGATMASGLTAALGTMTKPFHPGKAAADGVQAALLAERGFTGPPAPIEGRRGFAQLSSPRYDFDQMLDALGVSWELELNAFKPYACGIVSHPVIDAAIELRGSITEPDDILRVEVDVNPVVLHVMGQTDPQDGLSTKFSVYHCFAIGLLDGAGGPEQFSDSRARRPDVVALRSKVNAVTDRGTPKGAARVTVEMKDGTVHRMDIEHATGSAERPMSDARLRSKADLVVAPILGGRTDEFLDAAFAVDRIDAAMLARLSLPAATGR
jgi:2-methylcitrate dehydratase PrpD